MRTVSGMLHQIRHTPGNEYRVVTLDGSRQSIVKLLKTPRHFFFPIVNIMLDSASPPMPVLSRAPAALIGCRIRFVTLPETRSGVRAAARISSKDRQNIEKPAEAPPALPSTSCLIQHLECCVLFQQVVFQQVGGEDGGRTRPSDVQPRS